LELENPGNYSTFLTDDAGVIRLVSTTDGTTNNYLYRASPADSFVQVLEVDFKNSFEPVQFVEGSSHLVYALSNLNRDKKAAVLYDLRAGKEIEVLFEHEEFDAEWLVMSEKTKKPLMVQYTDWKSRFHFLDERVKAVHAIVRKSIPDDEITFTGADEAENNIIIRTFSDKTLGAYYLFNTQKKELSLLAEVSPWLDKKQMATVQPIKYQARDGLLIHGYLTIPNGLDPKNLPVVVLPHGGPWMRDVWRFDRNVQFLANRGYAVFQMNFRGSTGYGRSFWEASFKQWGKNMQHDITDGVQYLAEEAQCYWLIDVIASHQTKKLLADKMLKDFQLWYLMVGDSHEFIKPKPHHQAVVTCWGDTPDPEITPYIRQDIEFTDFPLPEIKLFLVQGVLMLPGEY
jgi:dipeptidyl aminopeptidase/acylaminoacyl peptidase